MVTRRWVDISAKNVNVTLFKKDLKYIFLGAKEKVTVLLADSIDDRFTEYIRQLRIR